MHLLAYQLVEKLLTRFYPTCYSFINEKILPSYFKGEIRFANELVEDALFNITGMLGKVQRDLKVSPDKMLDIDSILNFIYT